MGCGVSVLDGSIAGAATVPVVDSVVELLFSVGDVAGVSLFGSAGDMAEFSPDATVVARVGAAMFASTNRRAGSVIGSEIVSGRTIGGGLFAPVDGTSEEIAEGVSVGSECVISPLTGVAMTL